MSRRAVLVGSNGPAGPNALRFAKADTKRLAAALASPRCGFEVSILENTADPHEVDRQLADVADLCGPGDTFAIYFSGHGVVDGGSLLLMLDKTDIARPLRTALLADTFSKTMRYCKAQHKLLILDCCHAGAAFGTQWKDETGEPVRDLLGATSNDSAGYLAIVASDRLERTREIKALKGSFLNHAVCEALGDRFDEADKDRDGAINISDLMTWLGDKAKAHNTARPAQKVPIPSLIGRQKGDFYLSAAPTEWTRWETPRFLDHSFVLIPARASHYSAWVVGKTPVTNAMYRSYVGYTEQNPPEGQTFVSEDGYAGWKDGFRPWEVDGFAGDEMPVVCVNMRDAKRFADWYDERDGSRRFQVGLAPSQVWDMAAFGDPHPQFDRSRWPLVGIHDRSPGPASLEGAEARTNALGIVDLIGNIWEWTARGDRDISVPTIAFSEREIRYSMRKSGSVGVSENDYARITLDDFGSDDDHWQNRNLELRGGSFFDDLSRAKIAIASGTLHRGASTRHSDLGFRLAAKIALDDLPSALAAKLQNCRIIEGTEDGEIPVTA